MFEEEYKATFTRVRASGETYRRVMNMTERTNKRRSKGFVGKIAAAAAVISLLAVTASAAGLGGWFTKLFSQSGGQPLSDSQVEFIEAQEQTIQKIQSQNGWTVELRSAMNDGTVGYVILGVTAPESVSLEDIFQDGNRISNVEPGNQAYTPDDDIPEIITYPEGVFPMSERYHWEDDGDGKANTRNYVIQLTADMERSSADPFGPDAQWRICIVDFIRESENGEYYQELMNGKYKGQADAMFTSEETEKLRIRETLVDGSWAFDITFADSQEGVELVSQTTQVLADVWQRTGSGIEDYEMIRENVTLNSLVVNSLTATVHYEAKGGTDFVLDDVPVQAVMQDGTCVSLRRSISSGADYTVLEAETPIVLKELDYILFPDGTRFVMPK